jgi:hypothetical protein
VTYESNEEIVEHGRGGEKNGESEKGEMTYLRGVRDGRIFALTRPLETE